MDTKDIKITTNSEVENREIAQVLERQEVSSESLADAEAKLIKKVARLSPDVEWIVDIKYYQRPNGKFLLGGTPVILRG